MEQDFDKLKSEMETKVKESFELAPFFHHNLNNFAYRYFDQPQDSRELGNNLFMVTGVESKLKNALKSSEPKVVDGVKDLAKRVPYKENPAVQYALGIEVLSFDSSRGGEVKVFAHINWNFPEFSLDSAEKFSRSENFKFEDVIILRNKLAKILESVAVLFPES